MPITDDQYINVEVRGIIKTGVVAIGGETTGVTITANETTLELEITDKKLKALASKLNGQAVVAKGTLRLVPGVEIALRAIVQVTDLSQ